MSLLESAIGWLAPTACVGCGAEGECLCEFCQEAEIIPYGEKCFRCARLSVRSKTCQSCRSWGAPNFVWITTDYDGLAQRIVHLYKFIHQRAAGDDIARLMGQTFVGQNEDPDINKKNYLMVPVPTASERVRERSFDHASLLARKLAQSLRLEKREVLGRRGASKQVGSSRAQRLKQAHGTYYVKSSPAVAGRNILLVDDVVTTGATLSECARVLRQAGARSVDALVFAKRL